MPLSSNVAMFVPDIMCTLRCDINNTNMPNPRRRKQNAELVDEWALPYMFNV